MPPVVLPLGLLGINVEELINSISPYGEVVLWLIVFAETGLLIGFFLPGDSLLFTAGILAGQGKLDISMLVVGCFIAAVLGSEVGYMIGNRLGPRLFTRSESRLFKQEYVERTRGFFERHGPKTIILARFVPVVRTFTPVMAGVGEMHRRTYTLYNIVGALLWVVGVTMLGYVLGDAIGGDIDTYLLPLIVVIIGVSLLPAFFEWRRSRSDPVKPATPEAAKAEAHELEEILNPDD
jgi:membrane-associated protein